MSGEPRQLRCPLREDRRAAGLTRGGVRRLASVAGLELQVLLSHGDPAHRFCKPSGHLRGNASELPAFFGGQRLPELLNRRADPFRRQPGERPDRLPCSATGRRKLPRRRVAQPDFLPAELQCPARTRGQEHRGDRHLRRQTEHIGGHGAAIGDALAELSRERFSRPLECGRPLAKPPFDRQHMEAASRPSSRSPRRARRDRV